MSAAFQVRSTKLTMDAAIDIAAIDIAVCKAEFCHRWVVDLVHPCSAHLRQLTG